MNEEGHSGLRSGGGTMGRDDPGADRLADELAALRRVSTIGAAGHDDPYRSWLAAGRTLLDASRAIVLVGAVNGQLVVEAVSDTRPDSPINVGEVVEDVRVRNALRRAATVADLGGRRDDRDGIGLGPEPLVVAPIWSDGRVVGALAFQPEADHPPYAALDLALVDLVADGVARVMERESHQFVDTVGVPDPWDLLPDLVVRLDQRGHQVFRDGSVAAVVFDPCWAQREPGHDVDPSVAASVRSAVSGARRSGAVRTVLFTTQHTAGRRQVEARFVPDDDQVVCVIRDITDQHHTEQALAEQVSFSTLMGSVATRLLRAPDDALGEAIEFGLREMGRSTNADGVALYELDPSATTFHRTQRWGDPASEPRLDGPVAAALVDVLSRHRHLLVSDRPHQDGTTRRPVPAPLALPDGQSRLWFRLGGEQAPVGVALLHWNATANLPAPVGADAMIESGAAVFEGAILRSRVSSLAVAYASIAAEVARNAPLRRVLSSVERLVDEHALGASVAVLLVDDDGGLEVAAGGEAGWPAYFSSQPLDLTSPYGQAVVTGQPVLVADTTHGSRFDGTCVPDPRYSSLHVLPVASPGDRAVAALVVVLGTSPSGVQLRDPVRSAATALIAIALERSADQSRLAHQATHDPLTGLGNRSALVERLTLALERGRANDRRVGVLYCDLDGFKAVNDRYGHDHGDRLLVDVADRIRGAVRPEDLVSRTGGDEFVVVCEDLDSIDQAAVIAERVHSAVEDLPVALGETVLSIAMSVGVALADPVLDDADRLLRAADLAMYEAKGQGRRSSSGPALTGGRRRSRFTVDLVRALSDGELDVDYQVIVDRVGLPIGIESVLHWADPAVTSLGQDRVARAAAEAGHAAAVGRWFRRRALADRLVLRAAAGGQTWAPPPVHVTVAAADLLSVGFEVGLRDDLEEFEADPSDLVLGVLAGDLPRDDVRAVITAVAETGVGAMIDGIGTSGLALIDLAQLPVIGARIGPGMVRRLIDDPSLIEVARALVTMSNGIGWRCYANGVETDEQADVLLALGVDGLQGPLLGEALPVGDFATWLRDHVDR